MRQDVRSLIFCKSLLNSSDYLRSPAVKPQGEDSKFASYVALGDFDGLYVYKVSANEGENLLETVFSETSRITKTLKGGLFYHPRYIVYRYTPGNADEADLNDFWQDEEANPHNFFFATTVYLNHHEIDYDTKEASEQKIIDCINTEQRDLLSRGAENKFKYIIYNSLDLSDFVILWKAVNVTPVLHALNTLYADSGVEVGFTNTVCALPYQNLQNQASLDDTKERISQTESVDGMTVRVVSKDYRKLMEIKDALLQLENRNRTNQSLKGRHLFAIGSDDYLGIFDGVDTRILYEYAYQMIQLFQADVGQHIASINTTIGVTCRSPVPGSAMPEGEDSVPKEMNYPAASNGVSPGTNKESPQSGGELNPATEFVGLMDICKRVHDRLVKIAQENSEIFLNHPWINNAIELSNLVMNMSNSHIFDSVCFLVIESMHSFVRWVEEQLKQNADSNYFTQRLNPLNFYVNGLNQLMDSVVRADGMIVATPGYDPMIYNMPIAIVEYCGAYFKTVSRFFAATDGTVAPQEVSCLLVPTLCRRIKTLDMFSSNRSENSMQYLEIPVESFCDPFSIITALTHEAAHFYGDKCRRRKSRKEAFVECIAEAICCALGVYTKVSAQFLSATMLDCLRWGETAETPASEKILYLRDVAFKSQKIVLAFIQSKSNYVYFRNLYIESLEECERTEEQKTQTDILIEQRVQGLLYEREERSAVGIVEDIFDLFYEGYADVAMIYTLKMSFAQYLRMLSSEFKFFEGASVNQKMCALQRIFVVREACKGLEDFQEGLSEEDIAKNRLEKWKTVVLDDLLYSMEQFDEDYRLYCGEHEAVRGALNEGFYPYAVLDTVIDYLQDCLRSLTESVPKGSVLWKSREDALKMYQEICNREDYFGKAFQNNLSENRKSILIRNYDISER